LTEAAKRAGKQQSRTNHVTLAAMGELVDASGKDVNQEHELVHSKQLKDSCVELCSGCCKAERDNVRHLTRTDSCCGSCCPGC
jgi:hypothetical protein